MFNARTQTIHSVSVSVFRRHVAECKQNLESHNVSLFERKHLSLYVNRFLITTPFYHSFFFLFVRLSHHCLRIYFVFSSPPMESVRSGSGKTFHFSRFCFRAKNTVSYCTLYQHSPGVQYGIYCTLQTKEFF